MSGRAFSVMYASFIGLSWSYAIPCDVYITGCYISVYVCVGRSTPSTPESAPSSPSSVEDPPALRRSTRSTAGWNKNPFNDPRSVLLSHRLTFRETAV